MDTKIRTVLEQKGREVHCVEANASVMHAVAVMNEHLIGSVVVCENDVLVGIFTERDVLVRIVAERRDPAITHVRTVMSSGLCTLTEDHYLSEAMHTMTERRCRHIPIVTNGQLKGMLSIGDVTKALREELSRDVRQLESYIASPYVV